VNIPMKCLAAILLALVGPTLADDSAIAAQSAGGKTHAKLDEIIVPRVEFKESTLRECLEFLRQRGKNLDPEGTGVNTVQRASAEASERHVTFEGRDASLRSILEEAAKQAGGELREEAFAVVVRPKDGKLPRCAWTDDEARAIEQKLRGIRLKSVRVGGNPFAAADKSASARESFQTLERQIREADPAKEEIALTVRMSAEAAAAKLTSTDLSDLPAYEALRYVCEANDLRMRLHAKGVDIFSGRASLTARLHEWVKKGGPQPGVSRDDVEFFLKRHGETAIHYAAAENATHDSKWANRGLEKFRNDSVLLYAAPMPDTPEGKRERIEQLQKADPDNSKPWLLAAELAFKEKRPLDGIAALRVALEKPVYSCHSAARTTALIQLLVDSGEDPLEAEIIAPIFVMDLHLYVGLVVTRALAEFRKQPGSDEAARLVDETFRWQWELARKVGSSDTANLLITNLTQLAIEKMTLEAMPADARRDWLPTTVGEQLAKVNERRDTLTKMVSEEMKEPTFWDPTLEPDFAREYLRRFRNDGEAAAEQWVREQRGKAKGGSEKAGTK
jgi:hypothetical protein